MTWVMFTSKTLPVQAAGTALLAGLTGKNKKRKAKAKAKAAATAPPETKWGCSFAAAALQEVLKISVHQSFPNLGYAWQCSMGQRFQTWKSEKL